MSKRNLISLLIIGLLALGAAFGTYAWFTSQATSTENVFKTGTLNITGPGQITSGLSVENIFPSWTATKTVTVTNNGSIPFKYRVSVLTMIGNLLYDGPTPLQVSISRVEGNNNTLIKGFTNINELGSVELGALNEKDTQGSGAQIIFEFKLPSEADNTYQNKSANFTFVFDAIQKEAGSFNGIVADEFGYKKWGQDSDGNGGVDGYNVSFHLVGLTAKDLSSAEVSLYKDDSLLATNTNKNVLTLLPNDIKLSTPFDINNDFTDEYWNYGPHADTFNTFQPNKAVIKVITKDSMTYTAVNTNCSPAGPTVQ